MIRFVRRLRQHHVERRDRRQQRRQRHEQSVARARALVAAHHAERVLWSVVVAEAPEGLVVRVVLEGPTVPPPSTLVVVAEGGQARLVRAGEEEALGVPPWR